MEHLRPNSMAAAVNRLHKIFVLRLEPCQAGGTVAAERCGAGSSPETESG